MYQLKQTSPESLDKVTACHMACFPRSLGTRLGFPYCRRTLEWFLQGENRFLFHIEFNGAAIGYCGGFRSNYQGDGSTSGMLRFAMKEAIKGMIRNPTLIWNRELVPRYPLVVKNILKKVFPSIIKKNPLTAAHTFSSKLGLVVIGVHPSYRGTGCFEMLMQRFEEECKKRQVAEITLTVKASNDRAVAAYKKYGWQVSREARGSLEMFKTVDAAK